MSTISGPQNTSSKQSMILGALTDQNPADKAKEAESKTSEKASQSVMDAVHGVYENCVPVPKGVVDTLVRRAATKVLIDKKGFEESINEASKEAGKFGEQRANDINSALQKPGLLGIVKLSVTAVGRCAGSISDLKDAYNAQETSKSTSGGILKVYDDMKKEMFGEPTKNDKNPKILEPKSTPVERNYTPADPKLLQTPIS